MIAAQTALAVTGSTGRLGSRVARRLSQLGVDQRLVVRDPARHRPCPAPMSRRLTTVIAGRGPNGPDRRPHCLHGLRRRDCRTASSNTSPLSTRPSTLAYSGSCMCPFSAPPPTATFTLARDHWATEEHLRSVGVAHTILRDNIYADFTPHFIGTDGSIRGPAGDGRVALVAQADIAEVAIAVLTSDGAYDGRTLNLTGPDGSHHERDRRHPE